MPDGCDIATTLLQHTRDGDAHAARQLMDAVYDDLRGLAAALMARERPDHTLDPTSVVHEAYLRMIDQTRTTWQDRAHFFAIASEMMRRVLVDHARSRGRLKRGGDRQRVTLSGAAIAAAETPIDVLLLDQSLDRLSALSPRQAEVVKMRFFAGLTNEEVATVLGVHRSTVADDWAVARAWLAADMKQDL